jgi:cytochrome c oxidase subunit 4
MKRLFLAWLSLMSLAGLSFGVSLLHLGRFGLPVAILIAVVKAFVVLAIFMELALDRGSVRLVAATAVALLVVFVGLAASDPATRDPAPVTR